MHCINLLFDLLSLQKLFFVLKLDPGFVVLLLCVGVKRGLCHYDKKVLRRVIGPRNEKAAGGWRNLHQWDLHELYCSPYFGNIISLDIFVLNLRSAGTTTNLFIRGIPAACLCCKTFSGSLLNCVKLRLCESEHFDYYDDPN